MHTTLTTIPGMSFSKNLHDVVCVIIIIIIIFFLYFISNSLSHTSIKQTVLVKA